MSDQKEAREAVVTAARDSYDKVVRWLGEVWPNRNRSRLRRVWFWIAPEKPDPELEAGTEAKYVEAVNYFQTFEPDPRVDYTPTVAYMKDLHERLQSTDRLLDEKADSIIKYLGGGSAVITVGALFSLKTDSRQAMYLGAVIVLTLLPSLVYAIAAIVCAVAVRRPRGSTTLPDVPFAIKVAHFYRKEFVDINQWLILHPMNEAMLFRNFQKAKEVERAHRNYTRAMSALAVPVLSVAVALVWLGASYTDKKDLRDQAPAALPGSLK